MRINTKEEISFKIEQLAPFPLADLFRRFRVSNTSKDKLSYMFSFTEVSMYFLLVALSHVSYIRKENPKKLNLFGALTYGSLISVIRECKSLLSDGLIFQIVDINNFIEFCSVIIDLRNEYAHGGPQSEERAKIIMDILEPKFYDYLDTETILTNLTLSVVESSEYDGSNFKTKFRRCNGSNSFFDYEFVLNESPLPNMQPLISFKQDNAILFSTSPIIRCFHDLETGKLSFYFLNKYEKAKMAVWINFQRNIENKLIDGDANNAPYQKNNQLALIDKFNSFSDEYYINSKYHIAVFPSAVIEYPEVLMNVDLRIIGIVNIGVITDIYRCIDDKSKQVLSLKILKSELSDSRIARARIYNEIKLVGQLQKTNTTVKLLQGVLQCPRPFYIYKYEHGGSLYEFILRWEESEPSLQYALIKSCIENLIKIHSYNVIHRDIKPLNIYINEKGCIYSDFSLGVDLINNPVLTQHGQEIGTPKYLAPEIKTRGYSIYSDYYSLGIVLLEILCGKIVKTRQSGIELLKTNIKSNFKYLVINLSDSLIENRISALNGLKDFFTTEKYIYIEQASEIPFERPICRYSNNIGMEFVKVNCGEFLMGGTKFKNEMPIHKVVISKDFFIGKYPVTNSQFNKFRSATRYNNRNSMFLYHLRNSHKFPGHFTNPNSPVVFISWEDANEFLLWLSELEDRDYRLPTEAEWEYACRCGSRMVYAETNNFNETNSITDNSIDGVIPISSSRVNSWGISDMLGNCWEWCLDHYDIDASRSRFSPFYLHCNENIDFTIDPCNTPNKILILDESRTDNYRVAKGGSFASKSYNCRPANRRGEIFDRCTRAFGFRVVCKSLDFSDDVIK